MKSQILSICVTIVFVLLTASVNAQNTWRKMSNPNVGQASCIGSFSFNDFGYVMLHNGVDLKPAIWQYNPTNDTWAHRSNFPVDVQDYVIRFAFAVASKAYFDSGTDFWEYNVLANTWSKKSSFPGLMPMNTFVVNGKGYVVGSYAGRHFDRDTRVWSYDPSTDTWAQKSNVPFADSEVTGSGATFVINGKAYLAGGADEQSNFVSRLVLEYNPDIDSWTKKGDLPHPIAAAGGLTLGDKGFIAGGFSEIEMAGIFKNLRTTYEYDAQNDQWTERQSLPSDVFFGANFAIGCKGFFGMGFRVGTQNVYEYTPVFPIVQAEAASNAICFGDSISLTATGAESYTWTPSDRISAANVAEPIVWPLVTTTYAVKGTDHFGCSNNASFILEVSKPADILRDQIPTDLDTICAGESIEFEVVEGSSWSWYDEGGILVSNANKIIVAPNATTFYRIQAVGDDGCRSADTTKVHVNQIPASEFTVDFAGCKNDTSRLAYSGPLEDGLALQWHFNNADVIDSDAESSLSILWQSPGDHDLALTAILNGCTSTTTTMQHVKVVPTNNFTVPSTLCGNDSAIIQYTGDASPGATFDWNFNGGEIISGSGAGPYVITWKDYGQHTVDLAVSLEGCQSEINENLLQHHPLPQLDFNAAASSCHNEPYFIQFTGSSFTDIDWQIADAIIVDGDGAATPLELHWQSSGEKSIVVTIYNEECQVDSIISVSVTAPPVVPEICLLTVGQESLKNEIIWNYESSTVRQFNIYKEGNAAENYELIASVPVEGGLGVFVDEASSPQQRSNRYKIAAVDTCGAVTELSTLHKTIHLTINKGLENSWNLVWDHYEGFDFSTYRIHRSIGGAAFEVIAELPNNLHSYTDLDENINEVSYTVEALKNGGCDTEGGRIKQEFKAISNRANGADVITDLERGLSATLSASPIPSDGIFRISAEGTWKDGNYEILNLTGQIVAQGEFDGVTFEVDLSNNVAGIYLLRVFVFGKHDTLKLIRK